MEETRLPLSPMPHFASADFSASVFAYLPSRRLLTPRLGVGLAQFHVAMPPVLAASVVFVFACLLQRFQLWLVVMLRLPGLCPNGLLCCRDRLVLLFDVLAFVDAFGALLTAVSVLGLCLLGMGT